MGSDAAAVALFVCLTATALGRTAAAVQSSVTVSSSSVSSRMSSSSSSSGSAAAGRRPSAAPRPSVTRLVQEYNIPNGQAVKTTQIITGMGISGVTETMQITQTKKKQFSSTTTTQIGKAPAVTTVTSNTPTGTKVKLTLANGKQDLELDAFPPVHFDVKSLSVGFFKDNNPPGKGQIEDLANINAQIAQAQKKVDSVFKTGFFAAESEYVHKIGDLKQRFQQTYNKFRELGLKYPDVKLEF